MIIYVVMRHEGQYDDYSVDMVKGFLDKADADAHIVTLQEADARYNEIVPKAAAAFREWFNATGHAKVEAMEPHPPRAKGVQPKDEPLELRKERGRVQRENQARQARNIAAQAAWNVLAEEVSRQQLLELGVTQEELDKEMFMVPVWSGSCHSYNYSVEVLEVK